MTSSKCNEISRTRKEYKTRCFSLKLHNAELSNSGMMLFRNSISISFNFIV